MPAITPAIVTMTTPAVDIGACHQIMPASHRIAKASEPSTNARCEDISRLQWSAAAIAGGGMGKGGRAGRRRPSLRCASPKRRVTRDQQRIQLGYALLALSSPRTQFLAAPVSPLY